MESQTLDYHTHKHTTHRQRRQMHNYCIVFSTYFCIVEVMERQLPWQLRTSWQQVLLPLSLPSSSAHVFLVVHIHTCLCVFLYEPRGASVRGLCEYLYTLLCASVCSLMHVVCLLLQCVVGVQEWWVCLFWSCSQ